LFLRSFAQSALCGAGNASPGGSASAAFMHVRRAACGVHATIVVRCRDVRARSHAFEKQLVSCAFSIMHCALRARRRATAACGGESSGADTRPAPGRAAKKNLAGVLTVEKTVIRFRCNRRCRRRE
jgi:hypothetical protein